MICMDIKMNPEAIKRFFYWINERHVIYLKRKAGEPWPWTDDEILQKFKFTCPFRENDVGTVWLRENWREPFADDEELFFNICLYRQINYWPTCAEIGYQKKWDPHHTERVMRARKDKGEQVYTNAHMLPGTLGMDKIYQTVWRILNVLWDTFDEYEPIIGKDNLQSTFNRLVKAMGFGPFIAYEVVSDLRWTRYLQDADDTMTWANAGPGAMRGINRLYDLPVGKGIKVKQMSEEDYLANMRKLLEMSKDYLGEHVPQDKMDMRVIEHSACEWDKYERVRLGQGRPRLNFIPPHLRQDFQN